MWCYVQNIKAAFLHLILTNSTCDVLWLIAWLPFSYLYIMWHESLFLYSMCAQWLHSFVHCTVLQKGPPNRIVRGPVMRRRWEKQEQKAGWWKRGSQSRGTDGGWWDGRGWDGVVVVGWRRSIDCYWFTQVVFVWRAVFSSLTARRSLLFIPSWKLCLNAGCALRVHPQRPVCGRTCSRGLLESII